MKLGAAGMSKWNLEAEIANEGPKSGDFCDCTRIAVPYCLAEVIRVFRIKQKLLLDDFAQLLQTRVTKHRRRSGGSAADEVVALMMLLEISIVS